MLFRKDINALRSLAVISVVVYHFDSSWLPGGFIGVDVFFVISGFLMTGIILEGIESNSFSILKFYRNRANRILPALLFVCVVLLIFGWFYITPVDYSRLGRHISSSVVFLSNFVYWQESGYFDITSREKWLLHTWSLSVEWQFYILYPAALVFLNQYFSLNMLRKMIFLGAIAGFALCVVATLKWPEASFYLLVSRGWEMLIGGVAYICPAMYQARSRRALSWAGVLLLLGSCLFIADSDSWPGYLAIFPVLGTFFLILSRADNSVLINNIISQSIGNWSYSIYLWHWPLVVAIQYYVLPHYFAYIGMLLSVMLGFLSYRYIEIIRFNHHKLSTFVPLFLVILFFLAGGLVAATNGFDSHYSKRVVQADRESLNKNPYQCMDSQKDFGPCYIGNKSNIKAIIVGDSHADAITTSLSSAINLELSGIIALTVSSCPFILGAKLTKFSNVCLAANERRMDFITHHYEGVPVFWAARTTAYIYGLSNQDLVVDARDTKPLLYFTKRYDSASEDFFMELGTQLRKTIQEIQKNHPVYLIYPTPGMRKNIPKTLSRSLLLKGVDIDLSISFDSYQQRNISVRELIEEVSDITGALVLDPIPYLCGEDKCIAQFEGRPIYYDGDHLSEFGNKLLTPMFQAVMKHF